ncbi:MAG: ribonuclease P protein component [Oscillospiraceae bacterium]|jgi:ribonuclease P protein component|nr:ribonuclease P protein component [Oscillospiraceae bacterium]
MKLDVISDNKIFRRIYGKGKSFVSPFLVSYFLPSNSGKIRYGITASKKVGGAVSRNRARRIIKEAFRLLAEEYSLAGSGTGCDVIFVARAKTAQIKMPVLKRALYKHLSEANIIKRP